MSKHLGPHGFGDLRHEATLPPQVPSAHVVRDVGRHPGRDHGTRRRRRVDPRRNTRGHARIDCDARPAEVYPWLAQMGFGKAGWYSYDWLDNLGRKSATEIVPRGK